MRKIIIVRGALGVGKTTVSKILAEQMCAEYVSIDRILEENNLDKGDGIPVGNYLISNEIVSHLLQESEKSFIIDGCFYYQEQIDDLEQKINEDVQIFTLVSSVEICITRESKRNRVYGEDAARFVHMITNKVKAGYEIDNTDLSIEETVNRIVKQISKK